MSCSTFSPLNRDMICSSKGLRVARKRKSTRVHSRASAPALSHLPHRHASLPRPPLARLLLLIGRTTACRQLRRLCARLLGRRRPRAQTRRQGTPSRGGCRTVQARERWCVSPLLRVNSTIHVRLVGFIRLTQLLALLAAMKWDHSSRRSPPLIRRPPLPRLACAASLRRLAPRPARAQSGRREGDRRK